LPARCVKITEGTQLIDELEGCRRLIVVDACRGGSRIGAITRFDWLDAQVCQYHHRSTHGVGLCDALNLAARLGRLPRSVEIFGIEIGSYQPLDEISAEVREAVAELVNSISADVCETVHA
jgi:hydrogenase maturation protease